MHLSWSRSAVSPRFGFRRAWPRFMVVVLFAIAMAYVESAAVLYLRTIYGGVDPVGTRGSPFDPIPEFLWVEVGREAATIVMLGTVGWLAGQGVAGRFGGFVAAFGIWDIFYYVFLWLFSGWPASPLAPDVLFLIPLPWWGPVLSPVLIALLMAGGGGLLMAREMGDGVPRPRRAVWLCLGGGSVICLAAFMWGALQVLATGGAAAAFSLRDPPFPWPLYLFGYLVGAVGVWLGVAGVDARRLS